MALSIFLHGGNTFIKIVYFSILSVIGIEDTWKFINRLLTVQHRLHFGVLFGESSSFLYQVVFSLLFGRGKITLEKALSQSQGRPHVGKCRKITSV